MAEDDPYLDPGTGILGNLVGAETQEQLDRAEHDLATQRLLELRHNPVEPTRDLAELQAIHAHLFQDVYEWAGQLRTIDMRKSGPDTEPFLPRQLIGEAGATAARRLADDNHLQGMDRDEFVERLAYHYEAFNFTHPFREGNGRTQRLFWDQVATSAGWQLDWRQVSGTLNDHACRSAADRGDLRPLVSMLHSVVQHPDHDRAPTDAAEATRVARLAFAAPASSTTRPSSTQETTGPASPDRGRDPLSLRDRGLER